jgi:hypothetical protein
LAKRTKLTQALPFLHPKNWKCWKSKEEKENELSEGLIQDDSGEQLSLKNNPYLLLGKFILNK